MKNRKYNFTIIVLILLFLWAASGSRLAAVLFFIYLVILFKNIIKSLSKKSMAETITVNNPSLAKYFDKPKKIIITVAVVLLLVWLFTASIAIVEAGNTGVYSLFGKVRDREYASGFHLINPLAKMTAMSIRTEEYTMSIAQGEGRRTGADAITSLTKEGLSVDLDMTVLYHLVEDRAAEVYREVGLNYDEKVIRPTIRTAIRDIIAQYEAKDIYSVKREEAAGKILEKLQVDLEPRGIAIEEVLMRNVALPANLAQAIQDKLQAEQEAQKYDFILQREEKEKQRKVIEAEGQRESQRIINESLTTNYLYFLYVNQLKDREGTIYVPTSPTTGLPLFRNIGQ